MKYLALLAPLALAAACQPQEPPASPMATDQPEPATDGVCGGPGAWIVTQDADGNVVCTPGWDAG